MNKKNITLFLPKNYLIITISLLIISLLISIFPFLVYGEEDETAALPTTSLEETDALSNPSSDETAALPTASLKVNGKVLTLDVQPRIIKSRTMIPVRALFEEIGGNVDWDNTTKVATITYQNHTIKLTNNSNTAIVDKQTKTLDVPSQVIKGRTLIPLRFVAEALDFSVNWDPITYTAIVDTPNPTTLPVTDPVETLNQIKKVSVTHGSQTDMFTTVDIEFNEPITDEDYTEEKISNPSRYFIDFFNVSVDSTYKQTLYTTSDQHSSVQTVRADMNTTTTYRLVFDLYVVNTPTIILSSDKKTMTIKFTKNSSYKEPTNTTNPSTEFNPYSDGKLVVALDPGHGQSTGGKRSPDGTLREYEFNRDVASRIKTILENNGIQVLMTVSDNTDVSLASRCNTANSSNADIFVSIHANAFGNGVDWENRATGWEIYYYSTSNIGKTLAQYIHNANFPGIGIKDRGVKTANFYVIKNTSMPAVLIEHGFYTSQAEVMLLKSSSWRQTAAELDAKGIMNFLYSYKK